MSCSGKRAMTETSPLRPKKSVALSGVTAGNTALSTVGRSGNDLHYRGYDILEMANVCEFEEIAYLLIHEKLPNRAELGAYKARLRALRGLPQGVRTALEVLPATAHPMDVLRTGADVYSCITGAIGALRGPKHGGANEVALETQQRYDSPAAAAADIRARLERHEVIIGFGHPVYTLADPRNEVIKEVARQLAGE